MPRILYVEDEPDIREVVVMALELTGNFEIKACASGREALAVAAGYRPDLLILDVMMPEMDGPATLTALRGLAETGSTPAVFMTAKAQPTEIERFRALGAVDVISKPFDPIRLGDQVLAIWTRVHG